MTIVKKRVLFCLLSVLLLAGCLNRQPEEAITLTWWITYAEESAEYPAFEAIAEAFTEQTGYEVLGEQKPSRVVVLGKDKKRLKIPGIE